MQARIQSNGERLRNWLNAREKGGIGQRGCIWIDLGYEDLVVDTEFEEF